MSIKLILTLPEKEKGFWVISNFLSCFRHQDNHIWVNIELSHVEYEIEKRKKFFYFNDTTVISYPIQYLMYINIGDEFDLEGKALKKKDLNFNFFEWEVYTEPHKLKRKIYNHEDFLDFGKYFPFNVSSDGMHYYDLLDFEKANKESAKNNQRIILPSSVIAQFFYFLESDFNDLLYNINLKYILKSYSPKNIFNEGDIRMGRFFYEWQFCQNDKTIEALGNFLFSKDGVFLKSLYNCFKSNLKDVLGNPDKIPFNYEIPIAEKLKLQLKGNYYKNKDQGVFVVKEILNYNTKDFKIQDLVLVDKIEYQPDIYYTSSGEVKPIDADGGTRGIRKPGGKNSSEISGTAPSNPAIKQRNVTNSSKKRFGGIVDIEKYIDDKETIKVNRDNVIVGEEVSDGDTLHPENGEKGGKKRGIKTSTENPEEKDAEKTKTYLSEVIKVFSNKYKDQFNIKTISYHPPNISKVDFIEINKKGTSFFVYFIDAFEQRIQVVSKLDRSSYSEQTLMDIIDSIKKNNFYSWLRWRKSNFTFENLVFSESINRGVDNYVNNDFYKKEAKKFLSRINSIIGK